MIINSIIAAAQSTGDNTKIKIVNAYPCYEDCSPSYNNAVTYVTHDDIGILPKAVYIYDSAQVVGTQQNNFSFFAWEGNNSFSAIYRASGSYLQPIQCSAVAVGTQRRLQGAYSTSSSGTAMWRNNQALKAILIFEEAGDSSYMGQGTVSNYGATIKFNVPFKPDGFVVAFEATANNFSIDAYITGAKCTNFSAGGQNTRLTYSANDQYMSYINTAATYSNGVLTITGQSGSYEWMTNYGTYYICAYKNT